MMRLATTEQIFDLQGARRSGGWTRWRRVVTTALTNALKVILVVGLAGLGVAALVAAIRAA